MMRNDDVKDASGDVSGPEHDRTDKVVIWDMAKEFHVGRNTVANIAGELSIRFKYENLGGKTRAYVYQDEADRIRRVLIEKYE